VQAQQLVHPERPRGGALLGAFALGFGGWLVLYSTDVLMPIELGEGRWLSWLRLAADHAWRTTFALSLLAWSALRCDGPDGEPAASRTL
jgi:hypothetical protein